MLATLEEGLLPARQGEPVHRLAGERQPQAEQEAPDLLPGQPDHDVPEVDFRLVAGTVRLRHEDFSRAAQASARTCGFRSAT